MAAGAVPPFLGSGATPCAAGGAGKTLGTEVGEDR